MTTNFERVQSVADLLGDKYTDDLRLYFPDVEVPYGVPFGYSVLLQLRQPFRRVGNILIPDEAKDAERYRVQASLVRAIGNAAFCDRQTGKPWIEGAWYKPGDFIRAPLYGGDRFDVKLGTGDDRVTFVFIRDIDAISPVTGDPLQIVTG